MAWQTTSNISPITSETKKDAVKKGNTEYRQGSAAITAVISTQSRKLNNM